MNELDAIRERLAAATPGPWYVQSTTACFLNVQGGDRNSDSLYLAQMGYEPPTTSLYMDEGNPRYLNARADAEFIANAPADIATLLAHVDRLRDLAAALEAELAEANAHLAGKPT